MASAISQSSVATVVEDLVSDRSIPLKICMIVLNILQIISSWVAVCFFFSDIQEWTPVDVGVSGSFLIIGNYIIPGIANGIIYWRRWKRSTISYRRRTEEENKQAWVCLRIALSLLGIPTVGRYIETIMVSRKLDELEKKHLHASVNTHKEGSQLNPVGTSKLNSIINQKNYQRMAKSGKNASVLSGPSQNINMTDNSQDKVRKARRQYKRCEHDGALMALLAGSTGAGPFAIAILTLYFYRMEKINMPANQGGAIMTSLVFNILWLCATLTHFYPARHVQSEAEFERGVGSTNIGSLILLFISHLVQVVLRIICLAVFANWFQFYVLIFVIFHWLVGFVILLAYRCYIKTKTPGQSLISCGASLSALFFGYVGIFDFVNGNEGKTRLRYLVYYIFYYIENIIMLVVWIYRNPSSQIRYPIPFVCVILGLFWFGFLLLQLYLYYFSYSPHGSSICCCGKERNRANSIKYAEEARDPVFGVPLSQTAIPLWQSQQKQGDVGTASRISGMSTSQDKYLRPGSGYHGNTPSIMSIPSARTPPSILSQQSPFNEVNEKPRVHPSIKAPPVIQQKAKKENAKPPARQDFSSDSSSSNDELPKFTPKPIRDSQSHPDLSKTYSSISSESASNSQMPNLENKSQYKAEPVHLMPKSPNVSKSMDSIPYVSPAIEPNKHTKPIGYVTKPAPAANKGQSASHARSARPRNPNPYRRNPNSLQPKAVRNIR